MAKIHDVAEAELPPIPDQGSEALSMITFQDHWLRRFGAAVVQRLPEGSTLSVRRTEADEVWALIEGNATARLLDEREGSPTKGTRDERELIAPMRLLVPFGVRASLEARSGDAAVVRLMTHSLDEDPVGPEAGGQAPV